MLDTETQTTGSPAPPSGYGADRGWTRGEALGLVALIVLTAILRFTSLSEPPNLVFDEAYYAKDACLYVGLEPSRCDLEQTTEQSYVHPPLGKWLIAIGVKVFGYRAFGWRIMAAAFGTLMVLPVYLLARKLFKDRWIAWVAGFLVATDFLLIVQSRIAMLDIFLALFVVTGFALLAYDRDRVLAIRQHRALPFPGQEPHREPEWRFAAGAAFGLALSVKWSGALAIGAALLLALSWSVTLASSAPSAAAARREFLREIGGWAAAFILIPAGVYLSSYVAWFTTNTPYECPVPSESCTEGVWGTVKGFERLQEQMWSYHRDLEASHTYQSPAWHWPIVKRPVAYHYVEEPKGVAHHILAFGNPITWYAALIAGAWLVARSLSKRSPHRLILIAWGLQFLPWMVVTRASFFFYMTPVVPFMMIALAAALGDLRDLGRAARWPVRAYLAVVVLSFLFFIPIIYGTPLSRAENCDGLDCWKSRMWMESWI